MKTMMTPFLLLGIAMLADTALADDWRKGEDDKERLEKLVQLVPSTSHWMNEMGTRYQNLYWAAKQGKWEFAAYQAEEIEELAKIVALARPKRAASAQQFLDRVFPKLHEATASQDWQTFESAFHDLNSECMGCHGREDHPFVEIPRTPVRASSPVLNMP